MEVILDTSGILNSNLFSYFNIFEKIYLPKSVYKEIITYVDLVKLGLANLVFLEPTKMTISLIKKKLIAYMPIDMLSDTDLDVIALAYELRLPVLTEDYDIQNALALLNLKFFNFNNRYIKEIRIYNKFCPHCKKYFQNTLHICPICGSSLNTKIVKSKKLRKNLVHIP